MTDRQFNAYGDVPADARGTAFRGLANTVGAVLSVALMLGMGVWSYKLAVRDVSGVPVVRALEGPMRVAPEDPGGKQAAYQGLAVNAVAAEGVAAPLPERIVLAPPPVELDFAEGEGVSNLPEARPAGPADAAREVAIWTEATLRPIIEEMAAAPSSSGPSEAENGGATIHRVSVDVPGVSRSPVPHPRPAHDLVAEAAARAAYTALAPARSIDVDPESLPVGTRLVQLGAFDDEDAARAEWRRLDARFQALLEDKGRVIQQAESGERIFYRLRAHGFADEAEARRFCSVLLAEQAACIPVLIR